VYHSIGANLGKRCYLYRAIDHDGNLVDSRLSEKRDMDAARQLFWQAMAVNVGMKLLEFHQLSWRERFSSSGFSSQFLGN
jgi:transposase-like protein